MDESGYTHQPSEWPSGGWTFLENGGRLVLTQSLDNIQMTNLSILSTPTMIVPHPALWLQTSGAVWPGNRHCL